MIKYSKIKSKLPLNIKPADSLKLAYVTHYLQNQENGASRHFRKSAIKYLIENGITGFVRDGNQQYRFDIKWDVPFPPPKKILFTFIDLFAGIGGFRIPLQEIGGKCVFSSEFNPYCQKIYDLNFGEVPFGDITKIDNELIPNHDVLVAGFPCQPFSISGKQRGFEDTRGTVIYNVFKIIESHKPKVVFLENVKHLKYHDNGRTLKIILKDLEELGYRVSYEILNARDFGVPQNRERIIIIGYRSANFDFSKIKKHIPSVLKDFLDDNAKFEYLDEPYTLINNPKTQDSGLIFVGYRNKKIRIAGVRPGTYHLSRVHKQPNRIYSSEGTHPALPSQETSGRFWILDKGAIRKLTINECFRIMGFPEKFEKIANVSELYKQIGNSVCIPMVKEVGKQIKNQLLEINE